MQRNWADIVYPAIAKAGLVDFFDRALRALSSPFAPWIEWKMDAVKCPVNTIEYVFFLEIATFLIYIVVSKLTCKKPFDLDRMLHRGRWADSSNAEAQRRGETQRKDWVQKAERPDSDTKTRASRRSASLRLCVKNFFRRIVGITPEYTRGDKIIAWGIFGYSFVFMFGLCFLAVAVWNAVSPWPVKWWSRYFVATSFVVPAVVSAISTFWFGIGGVLGLRKLFRDLAAGGDVDETDDGRVERPEP